MERWLWLVGLVLLAVVPVAVVWLALGRRGDPTRAPRSRAGHRGGQSGVGSPPVTIDELENEVRVPVEDQHTEQPSHAPPGLGTEWEVEQRRVLKTYGIGN